MASLLNFKEIMKRIVFFFFLFTSLPIWSQLTFSTTEYDYGVIDDGHNRVADINIKNTGDSKIFIFRAEVGKTLKVRYSSKFIAPDSSVTMRIKTNPTKKGDFREQVLLHVSHKKKPIPLYVKGFVEQVPKDWRLECPTFDQLKQQRSTNFELEVLVIDSLTKKPIKDSRVMMVTRGQVTKDFRTNKKGLIRDDETPIGLYYFVVSHDDYIAKEFVNYVNRHKSKVVVELKKLPKEEKPKEPEVVVEKTTPTDTTTIVEQTEDKGFPPKSTEDKTDFSESNYKPNNIVFLVDVSSSMKYTGKLDLLKVSMLNLAKILRPIDKITIVSYASVAKVILPTQTVNNTKEIEKIISELGADGMTAGGKGIKLAYKSALQEFIDNGNNTVIMATDGDFPLTGPANIPKLVKKYEKRGVKMSLLSIKSKPYHRKQMRYLAKLGSGRHAKIVDFQSAENALIDEIKIGSRK